MRPVRRLKWSPPRFVLPTVLPNVSTLGWTCRSLPPSLWARAVEPKLSRPGGGGAHSESPRLPSGEASAGEAASEAQVAAASAETDPSLSRAPPTSAPKRFHVGVASAVQPLGTGGRATLPPLSPPVTRAVGSLSAGGPAIAVVI
jgi:hypothetical protein